MILKGLSNSIQSMILWFIALEGKTDSKAVKREGLHLHKSLLWGETNKQTNKQQQQKARLNFKAKKGFNSIQKTYSITTVMKFQLEITIHQLHT